MKRILFSALILWLLGVAAFAFAQPHRGAPMHGFGDPFAAIASVKAQLALNDAQQAQWASAVAQSMAAREAARDAWLALYSTFTPDQKAIVRDAIQAKLDRMASFREHLRERLAR